MAMLGVVSSQAAAVSIQEQGGWFESAYVTWTKTAGLEYNVYVSPASSDSWTKLDNELVREYPSYGRADALGLKAGSYKFKVVPVSDGAEVAADAAVSDAVTVKAHDRSGFAHKQAGSTGIGAYNNDGTLKDNARVLYVWANNAKTVSLDVATNSKGGTATYTGLQQIIYGYQKGDANGSYDKHPLCIRIIGTIKDSDMDKFLSSEEGIQIKGAKTYQKMNITIEGVGNDANIYGFGFLIRNAAMIELRNFGIMLCMDDAVSIDTDNEMIWVHNLDLFYGKPGSAADQVKGDGTIDMKGDSRYLTVSYNHLYDSGKASLCGMKSETGPNWITYHHNWFDHSDSRHPRIRTMSVHVFNNYFDGNAKYGVGAAYQSEAFVENNYFRNCKLPMLSSMQGSDVAGGSKGTFSGEDGGIIKSYGNFVKGAKSVVTYQQDNTEFDCWEATSRNDQVPSTVVAKQGGKTYSNFDTNATIMYSYTPDAADAVPGIVKGQYGAGRMQHGDFKWTFNYSLQDENYAIISELKSAVQGYQSTLIGFFDGQTVNNGGATVTVDAGDGKGLSEEVNESYVPTWGGGGGSITVSAGKYVIGTSQEYFWFNASNEAAYNNYVTAGNFITTDGVFNGTQEITNSKVGSCSDYIGSVRLPAGTSFTAYWKDGIVGANFYVSSNGSQKWKLEKSTDGTTWTEAGTVEGSTGAHPSCMVTATNEESIKYVRITNQASGARDIQGIKIATFDPDADPDADPADEEGDTRSSDATAEFTLGGEEIALPGNAYTLNVAYDADDAAGYQVVVTPAENATIAAVTGATAGEPGVYTIAAPVAGASVTATFRILAENQANTKTYTINIVKAVDPSTLPVTTGEFLYFPDGSKTYNTFFTVSGNTTKDKGTGSYTRNGETYNCNYALKMESSTVVTFTAVKDGTLKVGFTSQGAQTLKLNDEKMTGESYVLTTEVKAGTAYTIKKADVAYVLYIDLVYADGGSGGDDPDDPDDPDTPTIEETAFMATPTETGFDYYWFNEANQDEVNAWIADGTITLTDGTWKDSKGNVTDTQAKSSFKPTTTPQNSDKTIVSEKTGTIEIAKTYQSGEQDGGTLTFYCPNGVKQFKAYMFRTGNYNFHVFKSTDGETFTEFTSDTSTKKGKNEPDWSSFLNTTAPVWVKIQNTSNGGLNVQGVIITYEKEKATVLKGDANGSGDVTISDAVAVVDYILGNAVEGFNFEAADVNNDGQVNITDAVAIVDIILAGK